MIAQPKFEHGSFQLYPLVKVTLTPRELAVATCLINGYSPKRAFRALNMLHSTGYNNVRYLHRKFEVSEGWFGNCIPLTIKMARLSEWVPNNERASAEVMEVTF